MFAAAPRAKKTPRRAAAVGTETGRPVDWPEKRSMIRPIPNGIERDTVDDTHSCTKQINEGQRERERERVLTYESDCDSNSFPFRFSQDC